MLTAEKLKKLRELAERVNRNWVPNPDLLHEYTTTFNPQTIFELLDEIKRLQRERDEAKVQAANTVRDMLERIKKLEQLVGIAKQLSKFIFHAYSDDYMNCMYCSKISKKYQDSVLHYPGCLWLQLNNVLTTLEKEVEGE